MTEGVVIVVRPLTHTHGAYFLLSTRNGMQRYELGDASALSVNEAEPSIKYCTGWYDIEQHENHACELHAKVKAQYDSCFVCREKTGFNPAFYNSTEISQQQAAYNLTPHSVYIAYFGGGLAKAGIMADSRGHERLYEQGALWYVVVGYVDTATEAHKLEERLIRKGLKNSVTQKQKATMLEKVVNVEHEASRFTELLGTFGYGKLEPTALLDHFFFGRYPRAPIVPLKERPVSGTVRGVVGRYLVLENSEVLYGVSLTDFYGKKLHLTSDVMPIERAPLQTTLF